VPEVSNLKTLKALANFSPGLRFGNPGFKTESRRFFATLKELREFGKGPMVMQPFQGCEQPLSAFLPQGFKANPGLKLANAFSVHTSDNSSDELHSDFILGGYVRGSERLFSGLSQQKRKATFSCELVASPICFAGWTL
jgi:hypothetical protein